MDFKTVQSLNAPALYTMKNQLGALYWLNDVEYRIDVKEPNIVDGKDTPRPFYAWDLNYTSFGFGPYQTRIFYKDDFSSLYGADHNGEKDGDVVTSKMPAVGTTDAVFVRLVDVGN